MNHVIVFDVNETLLDLGPLRSLFGEVLGDAAAVREWFALLLHSSVATSVAGVYHDFGALGAGALQLLGSRRGSCIPADAPQRIRDAMQALPPHEDVPRNLVRLREAGFRLAALTNSPPAMMQAQMDRSGLAVHFEQLLSVDTVRRFKPAPEPYRMAAERLGVEPRRIRMVAAHDWDMLGALRAGCAGAYVDRGAGYHPLYPWPDIVGAGMDAVTDAILDQADRMT